MCKAKDHTEQLLNIYNSINEDFNQYSEELRQVDLYEQDILHIIENGNFNAYEGYKLAKMIYDNRQKRRQIKNELEPLQRLKNNFIDNNVQKLNNIYQIVIRKEEILSKLTENNIYNPRILNSTNIKLVANNTATEKEKIMRQKKTNKQIISWTPVEKYLVFVRFKGGTKNLLNKKDILDFDESKKVLAAV